MARLIVVSNRVVIPSSDGANHAGGLAVAVRSLLKRNSGLWFGWSGTVSVDEDVITRTVRQGGMSYVVTDLAAAMAGVMTNLGHKLGLYRAMAESGPISSEELARRTATNERSVREWLNGQVAGGYVVFDADTGQYFLPPEHVFVLANPDSP